MELIKKIKQTETQAQEIIEQAKARIAAQAEKGRSSRLKALQQAEQERKKAIEAAVAAAEKEGLAETKNLKAQAEKKRQRLHNKVANKTTAAVTKVIEHLRG
jgi:vacuolar-type H+-ATPase subunit H